MKISNFRVKMLTSAFMTQFIPGTVELMNVRIEKVYTFLDYVRGGYVHTSSIYLYISQNKATSLSSFLYWLNPERPFLIRNCWLGHKE